MGWIIAVIIGVMLLLLILNMSSRRNIKKSASSSTTIVLPPKESSKGLEDTRVEETGEESPAHGGLPATEDFPDKHERDAHKNRQKEAIPYGGVGKESKRHASMDWQKYFEDSIRSPFPESSLALPYLHEAHRLAKEGANPKEIEKTLEKAREIDPDAVAFYLGRMEIMKRLQNERY